MIKHIVFWKLKEHADGDTREANAVKMKTRLESCAQVAPGTLKFEVSLAQPGLYATHDIVLYSEFADKEALEAYLNHPQHVALKPFFGTVAEPRDCMDFEI